MAITTTVAQDERKRIFDAIVETMDSDYSWIIEGEGYDISDNDSVVAAALTNNEVALIEASAGGIDPESNIEYDAYVIACSHAVGIVDDYFHDYEQDNGSAVSETYDETDFYDDIAAVIESRLNTNMLEQCAAETQVFATALVGNIEEGEFQDAIGSDFDWSEDRREYARRVLEHLSLYTEDNLDNLYEDLENTPSNCLFVQVAFTANLSEFTAKMGSDYTEVVIENPALVCGNIFTGAYGMATYRYEGEIVVPRHMLTNDPFGIESCFGSALESGSVTVR